MVKNLNKDDKLELISQISESLKGEQEEVTQKGWKKLFGAFETCQSAEEIIKEVRSSRYSNKSLEDL